VVCMRVEWGQPNELIDPSKPLVFGIEVVERELGDAAGQGCGACTLEEKFGVCDEMLAGFKSDNTHNFLFHTVSAARDMDFVGPQGQAAGIVREEKVDCMCAKGPYTFELYDGLWVQCDLCLSWMHGGCVRMRSKEGAHEVFFRGLHCRRQRQERSQPKVSTRLYGI
jgi:hypothetical protein